MAVRRKRTKENVTYFGTLTCHQWMALIKVTEADDLIYKWMHIARTGENDNQRCRGQAPHF